MPLSTIEGRAKTFFQGVCRIPASFRQKKRKERVRSRMKKELLVVTTINMCASASVVHTLISVRDIFISCRAPSRYFYFIQNIELTITNANEINQYVSRSIFSVEIGAESSVRITSRERHCLFQISLMGPTVYFIDVKVPFLRLMFEKKRERERDKERKRERERESTMVLAQ
jgi:hypothetical protein